MCLTSKSEYAQYLLSRMNGNESVYRNPKFSPYLLFCACKSKAQFHRGYKKGGPKSSEAGFLKRRFELCICGLMCGMTPNSAAPPPWNRHLRRCKTRRWQAFMKQSWNSQSLTKMKEKRENINFCSEKKNQELLQPSDVVSSWLSNKSLWQKSSLPTSLVD